MSVAITSLSAYRELQDSGKELSQMARVALCVSQHPGITRINISRITHLNESRVAARVNALVKSGVLVERGTHTDTFTHAASKLVWPAEGENLRLPL